MAAKLENGTTEDDLMDNWLCWAKIPRSDEIVNQIDFNFYTLWYSENESFSKNGTGAQRIYLQNKGIFWMAFLLYDKHTHRVVFFLK